jgi:ABC-type Fe3+-hydroxamate transport system substrate-binding protein
MEGPLHPETVVSRHFDSELISCTLISVTNDGRSAESRTFSLEQVILWDPDVLMVTTPKDVVTVYTDPTFR